LDSMYEDLPVLILQNWEDATVERLESVRAEFEKRTFRMEKLFWPYWSHLIRAAQNAARDRIAIFEPYCPSGPAKCRSVPFLHTSWT
jgi:hypothetical protein